MGDTNELRGTDSVIRCGRCKRLLKHPHYFGSEIAYGEICFHKLFGSAPKQKEQYHSLEGWVK